MHAVLEPTVVYIDGFNFYYGLRQKAEWRAFYWLDFISLFNRFIRPGQELVAVKYFSARPHDPDKADRQDLLFQANAADPRFQLHLGYYLRKDIQCYDCRRIIQRYEEKESDVRLATEIVADAYTKAAQTIILVSADGDMAPAVEHARRAGANVHIYFPPNLHSSALAKFGSPTLMGRYKSRFRQSLLPDTVQIPDFTIHIPSKWKDYQQR
jgi:Uncharacterized conserved protein